MERPPYLPFSEKEEKIIDILVGLGLKRNVARILVFLARSPEATSRELERGTDLRQPEVSLAIRQLRERDWIESWESKAERKGRPVKIYRLSRPFPEILNQIEKEKEKAARAQRDLIMSLRTAYQA